MPPSPRALWRTVPAVCLAGSLAMPMADAAPRDAPAVAARKAHSPLLSEYDKAERDRRALDAMPEGRRTRQEYARVLNEYRAIYHAHPRSSHADDSVAAVADLLAAQGRNLHNAKSSRDAILQYEFLRREYPGSKLRAMALMREGEIFAQDLKDREAAQATYEGFLKQYPRSDLADQVIDDLAALATHSGRKAQQAAGKKPESKDTIAVRGSRGDVLIVPLETAAATAACGSAAALRANGLKCGLKPAPASGALAQKRSDSLPASSRMAQQRSESAPASGTVVQKRGDSAPASGAVARTRGESKLVMRESEPVPVSRKHIESTSVTREPVPETVTAQKRSEARPAVREPAPAAREPVVESRAGVAAPVIPIPVNVEVGPAKQGGKMSRVTGIRHWSTTAYTRVAIDLEDEVAFEAGRVTGPDRIFFDLHNTRLAPGLKGKSFDVQDDGFLSKVRVAQFSNDMTRVVLDVSNVSDYSAFLLPNPYRLIIDVHGKPPASSLAKAASSPTKTSVAVSGAVPEGSGINAAPVKLTKAERDGTTRTHADASPADTRQKVASVGAQATQRATSAPVVVKDAMGGDDETAAARVPIPEASSVFQGGEGNKGTVRLTSNVVNTGKATGATMPVPPVAALLNPESKNAKKKSGGKPSAAKYLNDEDAPSSSDDGNDASAMKQVKPLTGEASNSGGSKSTKSRKQMEPTLTGEHEAAPTAAGERSLVRALGLKVGRIVVDAGHGGHDSGTLGVDGIQEKDVVLDVAMRLGKLLRQRLGSDVIYTRDTDTFVPLETRTAIANKAQADLFISIHANSSHDDTARGVEVYYLNFTASPDALEVAARENAVSQNSIFQLSSLVKEITLRDKIEESREFASDVDTSLFSGIAAGNAGLKDRGVKKAPFVVLIGANMPSILAEISFVTNEDDAWQLRDPNYRQRIAESLYRGVAKYAHGLSGVRLAQNGRGGTHGY